MPLDVLYVATSNEGKLRDFAAAAGAFSVAIEPLPGLRQIPAPEEDGETFEANARLKAEYYSRRAPGLWVIADDSGLEVDALGGVPGVRSARFAEDSGFTLSFRPERSGVEEPAVTTDQRNNACLLAKIGSRSTPSPPKFSEGHGLSRAVQRPLLEGALAPEVTSHIARYRCVLALARDGVVNQTSEGSVEGIILESPRGDGGFGYDPLFFIPELNATMAEIDLATKQRISHRGNALKSLLSELQPHEQAR